jgi:hypothetical protein
MPRNPNKLDYSHGFPEGFEARQLGTENLFQKNWSVHTEEKKIEANQIGDDFAFLERLVRTVVSDFNPHAKGLPGGRGVFISILGQAPVKVGVNLDIGNFVSNPGGDEGLIFFAEGFAFDVLRHAHL